MPTAAEYVEQIDTQLYRLLYGPPAGGVGGPPPGGGGPPPTQPAPSRSPGEPPIEWSAAAPGGEYCPPGRIASGVFRWLLADRSSSGSEPPLDPAAAVAQLRMSFPSEAELLAIAGLARAMATVEPVLSRRAEQVRQAFGIPPGFGTDVETAVQAALAAAPKDVVLTAARVAADTPRAVFDAVAGVVARFVGRPRRNLEGLSAPVYQHPADLAVQAHLGAIPLLGSFVSWFAGFTKRSGELAQLGQAVEVTESSLPTVHKPYREACDALQVEQPPRLFVSGHGFTPGIGGMISSETFGVEDPYILLGQGSASVLDAPELTFLLGRELGHVQANHVKYRSLARWLNKTANVASLVTVGLSNLVTNVTLRPLLGLYYRRTAYTADRAGLLACQNREVAFRVLMKQSGFPMRNYHEMKTRSLIEQALRHQNETGGSALDRVITLGQQYGLDNPWIVDRAWELLGWLDDGYPEVLDATGAQRRAIAARRDSDPQMQELFDGALRAVTDWATGRFGGRRAAIGTALRRMVYEQTPPAGTLLAPVLRIELTVTKLSASKLEYAIAVLFNDGGHARMATITLDFPALWDDAPAEIRGDFIRYGTKVIRLLYPR